MSLKSSSHLQSKRIVRDSAYYLFATIFSQGIGLVRGMAIPLLLTPAQLGIWSVMGVIIGYGGNAHLGILHGMNRGIPLLRGQDKPEEVEALKDSVFWLNLVIGILVGATIWGASIWSPGTFARSLRIIAIAVLVQLIYLYIFSLLRADNRFGLVSKGVSALSFFSTLLIISLALGFQDALEGALIGLVVAHGIVIAYWFRQGNYRFAFRLRSGSIRQAFVMGVPITILGVLDIVFVSVDRWMIVAKLGETMLGYYALGAMANNLIGLVPGAVATVLYPRIIERFAGGSDPATVGNILTRPVQAIAALMVVIIATAAIGLPLVIQLFLTKYIPSLPVISILVPAAFFYSMANLTGTWLVAVNKQHLLMTVLIAATLISVVLDYVLITVGLGVRGVALGTVAGYAIYGLGYMVLAFYLATGQVAVTLRFLAKVLVPFAATVAALIVAGILFQEGQTPREHVFVAVQKWILVMSIIAPVLWWFHRDGDIIKPIRAYFRK